MVEQFTYIYRRTPVSALIFLPIILFVGEFGFFFGFLNLVFELDLVDHLLDGFDGYGVEFSGLGTEETSESQTPIVVHVDVDFLVDLLGETVEAEVVLASELDVVVRDEKTIVAADGFFVHII